MPPSCHVPRLALALATGLSLAGSAWPAQHLTRDNAPYDLLKANWMGANYLQALLNPRWDAVAFAHDCFGGPDAAGGLYFVDDQGRVIWCFANEAEYGPVARVEAVAAMARGILRARIPKSRGRYFFTIEGREALYLKPDEGAIAAYWLQDESTPFCRLQVSARHSASDPWHRVQMSASPEQIPGTEPQTSYRGHAGPATVSTHSFVSSHDRAPFVAAESARPCQVRVQITSPAEAHFVWTSRSSGGSTRASPFRVAVANGLRRLDCPRRWLLLESEAHLTRSDKTGWEAPELWGALNSMLLIACDPVPDSILAEGRDGGCRRVALTWDACTRARVFVAPFQELDPADREFVFDAADHVAGDGHFGCRPYYPVRTSTGFMGAVMGLASAAWMLETYGHADAPRVKAAALEALQAIVDGEKRGYHGERTNQAIIGAWYLSRVAPDALDYAHWARIWADRDLQRCPPGWRTPPWSDTALRAMRGWRYAWLITGDDTYRRAYEEALAEFELPGEVPLEAFLWRGTTRPFDGYECTGAAMLLGDWGQEGDARADALVRNAGAQYMCDLGFAPLRTWTCDDLLPYYVGYSLPAVYRGPKLAQARVLKLNEYASYDAEGHVTILPRPPLPEP